MHFNVGPTVVHSSALLWCYLNKTSCATSAHAIIRINYTNLDGGRVRIASTFECVGGGS